MTAQTNDEPLCPVCGSYQTWEDCPNCDEGCVDDNEDDAVNFVPGEELRLCEECQGHGGWWQCAVLPHTAEQMAGRAARPK